MSRLLCIALFGLLASVIALNPDDPTGQTLYITNPACGYYKCVVTWHLGESQLVNWLGPPAGNVDVSLASNNGGPTYLIAQNVPATSSNNLCDAGQGFGVPVSGTPCGAVQFTIPLGWELRTNYTIVVQSLSDSSAVGYTDNISLVAADGPTSAAPAGTQAAIVSATTAVSGYLNGPAASQTQAPTSTQSKKKTKTGSRASTASSSMSSMASASVAVASTSASIMTSMTTSQAQAGTATAASAAATPTASTTPNAAANLRETVTRTAGLLLLPLFAAMIFV